VRVARKSLAKNHAMLPIIAALATGATPWADDAVPQADPNRSCRTGRSCRGSMPTSGWRRVPLSDSWRSPKCTEVKYDTRVGKRTLPAPSGNGQAPLAKKGRQRSAAQVLGGTGREAKRLLSSSSPQTDSRLFHAVFVQTGKWLRNRFFGTRP
jgi:hypothetical protein